MRKQRPGIVLAATLPILAACVRLQVRPLPTPETRPATAIRGVVLNSAVSERIEFERVDDTVWTDSTLAVTGVLRGSGSAASGPVTTRTFPLSDVGGVLVREIDADRTSIIIAAVGVGTAVIATLLLSGEHSDGSTVIRDLRSNLRTRD